jgi:hypothetical protein
MLFKLAFNYLIGLLTAAVLMSPKSFSLLTNSTARHSPGIVQTNLRLQNTFLEGPPHYYTLISFCLSWGFPDERFVFIYSFPHSIDILRTPPPSRISTRRVGDMNIGSSPSPYTTRITASLFTAI